MLIKDNISSKNLNNKENLKKYEKSFDLKNYVRTLIFEKTLVVANLN